MLIKGTKKEVEWALQALANGCTNCPFEKICSENAQKELEQGGDHSQMLSCERFLAKNIKCEIVEEKQDIGQV